MPNRKETGELFGDESQEFLDQSKARDKGTIFEKECIRFLQQDYSYKDRFEWVKSWSEYAREASEDASLDAKDRGTDLVAQGKDGRLYSIQCKYRGDPNESLKLEDISTWLSDVGTTKFNTGILITTTWGVNDKSASKQIDENDKSPKVITRDQLIESSYKWGEVIEAGIFSKDELKTVEKNNPLDHQKEALKNIKKFIEDSDRERGKLIMACGSGKTFTALKAAEEYAGIGKSVLYMVPSISLMQQSMREWSQQSRIRHAYIGICSDGDVSSKESGGGDYIKVPLSEMLVEVSTDVEKIKQGLKADAQEAMRVVFCTYQSSRKLSQAVQELGHEFAIIFFDEAHHTTGIDKSEKGETATQQALNESGKAPVQASVFHEVHNQEFLPAKKRIYMTATDRIMKNKSSEKVEFYSMDNKEIYGEEIYKLGFAKAVERGILAEYEIVLPLLPISQAKGLIGNNTYIENLSWVKKEGDSGSSEREYATYRYGAALAAAVNAITMEDKHTPVLRRVVAFANTIKDSKNLSKALEEVSSIYSQMFPEAYQLTTDHVDGKDSAGVRKSKISELEAEKKGHCKLLSNARCLGEGVDIPALDAIAFFAPKKSVLDCIQAVGRVMRKAEGKKKGYVILPVPILDDRNFSQEEILNIIMSDKTYAHIAQVLRALASHDESLYKDLTSGEIRKRIKVIEPKFPESDPNSEKKPETQLGLAFDFNKVLEFIENYVIDLFGTDSRERWLRWSDGAAEVVKSIRKAITELNSENPRANELVEDLTKHLQESVDGSITKTDTKRMLANHIVVLPVLNSLYDEQSFAKSSPMVKVLDENVEKLRDLGLSEDLEQLSVFYEGVAEEAKSITTNSIKNEITRVLFEDFIQKTMGEDDAAKYGVAFTPPEVVDFILHSVNDIMKQEFQKSLDDEGVNILDPFVGTGTFITRLLNKESGLISDDNLSNKFKKEIHAIERLLLSYYISTITIQDAYYERSGNMEIFENIIMTDTFETLGKQARAGIDGNTERINKFSEKSITAIIGNPPYTNKYVQDHHHEELKKSVKDKYEEKGKASKDAYIKAFRWATDKLMQNPNGGVIGFITPSSYFTKNSFNGVRGAMEEEFSSVYFLDCRGDIRKSGEEGKREGGKLFGGKSTQGIGISIFIRNPSKLNSGKCQIVRKDIGDYLSTEQKLEYLKETKSFLNIPKSQCEEIHPNKNHDWLDQIDPEYETFLPMDEIFHQRHSGLLSSRDAYAVGSSRTEIRDRAFNGVKEFNRQLDDPNQQELKTTGDLKSNSHSKPKFKKMKQSGERLKFYEDDVIQIQYRPFFKQWYHRDRECVLSGASGVKLSQWIEEGAEEPHSSTHTVQPQSSASIDNSGHSGSSQDRDGGDAERGDNSGALLHPSGHSDLSKTGETLGIVDEARRARYGSRGGGVLISNLPADSSVVFSNGTTWLYPRCVKS